jgi:diacylglycerol kinase (ATP)
MVLGFEGLNSALEKLCDEVTLERKETIRNIKDIAAGAVLVCAIIAVIIAGLIFGNRLIALF